MSLRDDQLATLKAAGKDFDYYNIANLDGIDHLPYSLKVLVENLVPTSPTSTSRPCSTGIRTPNPATKSSSRRPA